VRNLYINVTQCLIKISLKYSEKKNIDQYVCYFISFICHISGYTLTYQKKDFPISKVTKSLSPTTLNYTVIGLAATTVYTIEVYASTEVGDGPSRAADIESGIPPGMSVCQMWEKPVSPETVNLTIIQ